MKKKIIGLFVCMLLIAAILPITATAGNEKAIPAICESGNYNLIQQLNPTRTFFPRIYRSGTIATFDAYVINEGPDESSDFTLELKWTRIFGPDSEVLLDVDVGEYGPLNAGYKRHVYLNLECYVSNSFFNVGINVYEVQITNTADDLNPDDNTASFKYIVIGF